MKPAIKPIAIATAALLLAATPAFAQDAEEPGPEQPEAYAYACIVFPAVSEDPDDDALNAIEAGSYEFADSPRDCITTPLAQDAFEPLRVRTKGQRKSKPFFLPEGDYEFSFKMKGAGCRYRSYGSTYIADPALYDIEDDYRSEYFEDAEPDFIFGVEEGLYYVEVDTVGNNRCSVTTQIKQFDY